MFTESELRSPNSSQSPDGRSVVRHIPFELLVKIFKYAVPPDILFDLSIDADSLVMDQFGVKKPTKEWFVAVRMKKSIVLVCQSWHSAGIDLLYGHPTLVRFGQLERFLHTIQSNSSLANLVRFLEIVHLPSHDHERKFRNFVDGILQPHLCRRMYRLAFNNKFWDELYLPPLVSHPLSSGIPPISHLDLGRLASLEAINTWARIVHTQLEWLSITIHPLSKRAHWEPLALTFPRLHFFRCAFSLHSKPSLLQNLTNKWDMPILSQLSVDPRSWASFVDTVPSFCLKYRQTLRFICFQEAYRGEELEDQVFNLIGTILNSCPLLEHAVVPEAKYPQLAKLHHPNIEFLDFCTREGSWDAFVQIVQTGVANLREGCPQLKSIRTMNHDHPNLAEIALTTRTPVDIPEQEEPRYPGVCEIEEGWQIKRMYSVATDCWQLWRHDI